MQKMNEKNILQNLLEMLELLIGSKQKKKIACGISDYCAKVLKKYKLSNDIEEILTSCIDLNHWGWTELPPSLSLKEIKELREEIKNLLRKNNK